jgi:hypothetical protein
MSSRQTEACANPNWVKIKAVNTDIANSLRIPIKILERGH